MEYIAYIALIVGGILGLIFKRNSNIKDNYKRETAVYDYKMDEHEKEVQNIEQKQEKVKENVKKSEDRVAEVKQEIEDIKIDHRIKHNQIEQKNDISNVDDFINDTWDEL